MTPELAFPFADVPAHATTLEVAPGVFWVRMPLPFRLNHINLWVLDDGDGWVVVDTGIHLPEVTSAWESLFENEFGQKPIKYMIVTHFHPDHVGNAGWFEERFGLRLKMTLGEWGMARNLKLENFERSLSYLERFYHRAGFSEDLMALIPERGVSYPNRISIPPAGIIRMHDAEHIQIGGHDWRVIVAKGHSPEHACLMCDDLKVLISGDQILPLISPNISIWPQEPYADPLSEFLGSLSLFADLPQDTLVLPSHNTPFTGLHYRLKELSAHHQERLEQTYDLCASEKSGYEVLQGLFTRKLDSHQIFFAIGEALAHLHHLEAKGRLVSFINDKGVAYFKQA